MSVAFVVLSRVFSLGALYSSTKFKSLKVATSNDCVQFTIDFLFDGILVLSEVRFIFTHGAGSGIKSLNSNKLLITNFNIKRNFYGVDGQAFT